MRRRASWCVAALTLWLLWPAGAQAATRPTVTTGAAANIAQTTVTLTGTVNPNGAATTYFFQYGTTSLYGAQTPATAAGGGTKAVHVAASVTGLAPFTTYHYRLVATNAKGLTKGRDRTFKTKRQPLGLSLTAIPNPVRYGSATTLSGMLSGTGNGGREVELQANPAPYTQGFANVGNVQLTNSAGGFSFTPPLAVNTLFRVVMPQKPTVQSPIVAVGVAPIVSVHVRRGARLRFSGAVRPGLANAIVAIQKRRHHRWVTIARTFTHQRSATRSTYRRRVRRRSGRYRVMVLATTSYVAATSRSVRVR